MRTEIVSVPPDAIASRALAVRFNSNASRRPPSMRTVRSWSGASTSNAMSSPRNWARVGARSRTNAARSMSAGRFAPGRPRAISWRTNDDARSTDCSMAARRRSVSAASGVVVGGSRNSSTWPRTMARHVVEVVGDAAGECAEGLHLGPVDELILELSLVRDVDVGADHALRAAGRSRATTRPRVRYHRQAPSPVLSRCTHSQNEIWSSKCTRSCCSNAAMSSGWTMRLQSHGVLPSSSGS